MNKMPPLGAAPVPVAPFSPSMALASHLTDIYGHHPHQGHATPPMAALSNQHRQLLELQTRYLAASRLAALGGAAGGHIVCEHTRIIDRRHDTAGHTVYDWRHYLAVLQRKPRPICEGRSDRTAREVLNILGSCDVPFAAAAAELGGGGALSASPAALLKGKQWLLDTLATLRKVLRLAPLREPTFVRLPVVPEQLGSRSLPQAVWGLLRLLLPLLVVLDHFCLLLTLPKNI